jgi:hypothetical protein
VFWLDDDQPGVILRKGHAASNPTVFFQDTEDKRLLAADGTYIYWSTFRSIHRMRKDLNTPETLADGIAFPPASGIVGRIYGDELFLIFFKEEVWALPTSGGTPRVVAARNDQARWPVAYGADDRYFYWIGSKGSLSRVPR